MGLSAGSSDACSLAVSAVGKAALAGEARKQLLRQLCLSGWRTKREDRFEAQLERVAFSSARHVAVMQLTGENACGGVCFGGVGVFCC